VSCDAGGVVKAGGIFTGGNRGELRVEAGGGRLATKRHEKEAGEFEQKVAKIAKGRRQGRQVGHKKARRIMKKRQGSLNRGSRR
jgi:hypothetical protein